MKKLLISFFLITASFYGFAVCSTTDATDCVCADGSNDCDLLPDITISAFGLAEYLDGPTEYSQTGNGQNNGRLRVSGSTPNMGYGAFTVGAADLWTCGTDTFTTFALAEAACGSPSQLIKQKIYHKSGNQMTYSERWAGSMTYHPAHGHMHVDDWAVFTLRSEDPNEPDPRNWPIIGEGSKIGFCLMDFGSCPFYDGHCRDNNDVIHNDASQFPNYGLGGGQYNCSPVEQGISVGYTDIYSENLDGMWIDIPAGTCNGDYYIVIEVDPNNNFLESDETNNWTYIPFTLTEQVPFGSGVAQITASDHTTLCGNGTIELTANFGDSYNWSNGATTRTITVSNSGNYSVEVSNQCGTATSDVVTVDMVSVNRPTVADTEYEVCKGDDVVLSASGSNTIRWYDGGTEIGEGESFNLVAPSASTTLLARNELIIPGATYNSEPHSNTIGSAGYSGSQYNGYLEFDAYTAFELVSVKVYTDEPGIRIIELRNSNDDVLQSKSVNIPTGESRVQLNFEVSPDNALILTTNEASNNAQFGDNSPELERNDDGVAYPYVIPDVLSINDSRYGEEYYYYFYDWEVKEADYVCASEAEEIDLIVNELPMVEIVDLEESYDLTGGDVTLNGTPAGGTFSGDGVVNGVFSPESAGEGGPYSITYTYTDAKGCTNQAVAEVSVFRQTNTAIALNEAKIDLSVSPNPGNGEFLLELSEGLIKAYTIYNQNGKQIADVNHLSAPKQKIDISAFANGIYLLSIETTKGIVSRELIVQ